MTTTRHFTGSKGNSGLAQFLINLMPVHRVYVEPFLGRGVILNTKRPAAVSVGIDYDAGVIAEFLRRPPQPNLAIVHGDALQLLPTMRAEADWLIYADPPYLMSTRSCQRNYYGRELHSDEEHDRLLSILTGLQCNVMVSGYQSELYARRLASWNHRQFWTVNRRGQRVAECVWFNFPAPTVVYDPRFAGDDFTDRQRIKRKVARWTRKFLAMEDLERQSILSALLSIPAGTVENGCAISPDDPGRIAKAEFPPLSGQRTPDQNAPEPIVERKF